MKSSILCREEFALIISGLIKLRWRTERLAEASIFRRHQNFPLSPRRAPKAALSWSHKG